MNPTRTLLNRRLANFVDWIRPDDAREDAIRHQADGLRQRVRDQAHADGLVIQSTPQGGSFAKRTGLRRHITGGSEVEGLDVDLHFVVAPRTRDDEDVSRLLPRFERYARAIHPQNDVSRTKSSVVIAFTETKLTYDLVPVIATEDPEWQILWRSNGEKVRTSVQKHVELIRSRTRSSNGIEGRVKFNECVRLFKWWREFRQSETTFEVPSLLIDLLCAKAYDTRSVQPTYHETLADWFGLLAGLAQRRVRVDFTDFHRALPAPDRAVPWEVLDAVSPGNNVVRRWTNLQIDQLAERLAAGRDAWTRAIQADLRGDDAGSLRHMVELFGTPFKHHCEGT